MDFHQLQVFTKVVEHKSFSKAADDIFLSQSTVSSHIQSLERMLKVQLFDRVGREVILTPHGERLYHWALKLLLLKDEALLDLNQGRNEFRGVIRIAASSVPAQFIVPGMVKRFKDEYPSVTFRVSQSSSKIVADKVLNGSVDLGLLGEKYENEKLQYIPLVKEKLVLIASKDEQISFPVTVNDIIKYPFIMRNSGSGTNTLVERFLKKHRISKERMNIIAYTDDLSMIQFVKQGIGVSIISEIAAREYFNSNMINMYEIEDFNDERFFYLVYNKDKTLAMVSRLFIDTAKVFLHDF
ncbi:selenium metabolism-associated LysR family transcriptional regulator [Bacillus sp. T33-2]|uniref:selenium metabolism-associated LysR family transcriptional regulator n=1 Tax=Bacillus sp. T33-2 TaxID=2054168 RepID=UPI000C755C9F|nr:selenium metabolism-associated LysR family transcriptional regulator [Bacillus sp. T33-2]PLR89857.1 LysR family transcriptional regulator [Bacillus sp. T33-2]